MTFLRKYIWVFVILGMVFVSLVISLIFLFVNKCISTKEKRRVLHFQKRCDGNVFENNKYQERNWGASSPVPSLPPRTQFLTADALGFEDLTDEHDYEQMPDLEQSTDRQPGYVKVEQVTKLMSPCFPNYSTLQKRHSASSVENYKDVGGESSFEEQPDYIKVEEELPPPPFYNNPNGKSDASLGGSYENLAGENVYEESVDRQPDYDETETFPPLPPLCNDPNRTSGGSLCQSYENLAGENVYEESVDRQPDYDETETFPPLPPLCNDPNRTSGGSLCQSYENLAEENNYEESTDQQPGYVTAEAEDADPAADDISEEDYDDIGSDNEADYDDVA